MFRFGLKESRFFFCLFFSFLRLKLYICEIDEFGFFFTRFLRMMERSNQQKETEIKFDLVCKSILCFLVGKIC